MTRRNNRLTRIGFGGGCHWCTEAVFAGLCGVRLVEQGFICSNPPDDQWSEAVRVTFDPELISQDTLIEIHLRTHSSTSAHQLRGKYRSAIYTNGEEQSASANVALKHLQDGFEEPLVTRVLTDRGFRPSDQRYQRYFEKHANGPFCRRYIDPKLAQLRRDFAGYATQGEPSKTGLTTSDIQT